ncbi:unnamed protein product [Medioppia subpectinata]|uniref:Uncharacterized protein n=1 Tax=Medioppia subpectinata TaxID=1979941 RepID=A0A7R9Q8K2_9ACAR|nr:unnamed protein product [Medioppia subpectinata]CAG2115945.1 unnamed protein product [Medioppia subpectinata]
MDNKCFTYHTSSDIMFAGIQNGRVVQKGEQPWTVFITNVRNGICGANCAVTDIRVYPGLTNQSYTNHPFYTGGQYFVTPEHELKLGPAYDLGLIRLNTAIPLDGTTGSSGINSICLPEKMAVNEREEYVQLVGFGVENNSGTGWGIQRIGFAKITKAYADNSGDRNYALFARRVLFPSGSGLCTVSMSGIIFRKDFPDPT